MTVERADPGTPAARALLAAHAADMEARYPGESWSGIHARFDAFWLARDGDRAVGCVGLRALDGVRVEVKHLFVAPQARGRGVASALMDAFETEARARGSAVVLETGDAQPEAIALYERRGYLRREAFAGSETNSPCSIYFERPAR
jgi:ribosomal protein S18 acetylase RimI-like enzyme